MLFVVVVDNLLTKINVIRCFVSIIIIIIIISFIIKIIIIII